MSSSTKPKRTTGVSKDIASHTQRSSSRLWKPRAEELRKDSEQVRSPRPGKGIRFVIWLDEQGIIHQFQLSGHAGYSEAGRDIVCAAISALGIAAVNGLEHFLSVSPRVREENGLLSCSLEGINPEEMVQAQWILGTLRLGIEEIQEAYGKRYIMTEQRRWTPC